MSDERLTRRDAIRIGAAAGVGATFAVGLGSGLARLAGIHRVRRTVPAMGTVVTLTVDHVDAAAARDMLDSALAEMRRLEAILTRHRPEAPLGTLNRTGRIDRAPEELHRVLGVGLRVAARTSGAFDPTVLPVLRSWERARERGRPRPDDAEVDGAARRVGYHGVRILDEGLALDEPGMAITLDGIAKGYVVDRIVATLVRSGADRVLVDAGGDVGSGGDIARDPWTVALADPAEHAPVGFVELNGGAVATSGGEGQSFTEDRSHHHIIDPRTGRSPSEVRSASVTAPTAMEADALSTALLVLGPEEGRALVGSTPGVGAVVVARTGARIRSGILAR